MEQMFKLQTSAFVSNTLTRKFFSVLTLGILLAACKKDKDVVPGPGAPGGPGTPPPTESYFASKVNMQLSYKTSDDDGPTNHTLTVTGTKDSAGGKVVNYRSVYSDGTTIHPFIYSKDGVFTLVNTAPSELNEMIEELKNDPNVHDFTLTGLPLLQKLPANPQAGATVQFSEPMHMGFNAVEEGESYRVDMYFGFSEGKIIGFEDVTTEAGTFKNCMKWQFKSTITLETAAGNNVTEMEVTQWFAKGVGLVKSIDKSDNTTATTTLTGITGK